MERLLRILGALGMTFGLAAVFSPPAWGIEVKQAKLRTNGEVKLKGKGASPGAAIIWEGRIVTRARQDGRFRFSNSDVPIPRDCFGTLRDGEDSLEVHVRNCIPDRTHIPVMSKPRAKKSAVAVPRALNRHFHCPL